MAQIEVPQVNMPDTQMAGIPSVRADVQTSAESFGGGPTADRLADQSDQMASTAETVVGRAKREADQVAVMNANAQLTEARNDLVYNPNNGLMTMKGKDAFQAPEKVMGDFDQKADAIAGSLSNDRQRMMFEHVRMNHAAELDGDIQKHVFGESQKYDSDSTDASIQTAQNDAILNYHDQGKVKNSIATQQALIQDFGQRQGWSDDMVSQKVQDVASNTHSGVISRMLANDQDLAAKQYFTQNKDQMNAKDTASAEKALEEGSLRGESQRQADKIVDNADDRGDAMDQIRSIKDPKLRDETERRVSQYYSEQKQAEHENIEDLYLQSTNMLDQNPGKNARDVIPPDTWSQLPLNERTALENRSRHDVENDDEKWLDLLSMKPTDISQMTRADFETNYWSRFDQAHRTRAEELWTSAQKGENDPKLTQTLSANEQLEDTMRTGGILPGNFQKGKLNRQQATMYAQYETAFSKKLEDFERTNLGGKRKATQDERQQILDGIVKDKVFVNPGWISQGTQKPAATVSADEKGTAYVPLDKIPQGDRAFIENSLKSKGKQASKDVIQRAYAAYLMGDKTLYNQITAGQ